MPTKLYQDSQNIPPALSASASNEYKVIYGECRYRPNQAEHTIECIKPDGYIEWVIYMCFRIGKHKST